MSKCITVCPIGSVGDDILKRLAARMEGFLDIACNIAPQLESLEYAYNEKRRQYNAKIILYRLLEYPNDCLRRLAVVDVDLYVPVLKFVFGLSQIDGCCAVISLHRLHPEFYGQAPDPLLLAARTEKTAFHELGHSLGLTHCRNRYCVMYASTRITDTDGKRSRFCPTCFELLRWHLDQSLQVDQS